MTPDGIQLIRRLYQLWNSGDEDELLSFIHPDFEYKTSGVFPGFDPVYRGPEGMARFRSAMLEAWDSFSIEPIEIVQREDHFIADLEFVGRGHSSGVEVRLDFHHVGHLRDGKVDRLVSGPTREQTLADAGLS